MIVKDESPVIRRCLDSVRGLIDSWVIVDTGSTDGTKELIRESLKEFPGQLHERPWVDFAHNRNEALELARGTSDYLLFIDADDELVYDEAVLDLKKDCYLVQRKKPSSDTGISYAVLLVKSCLNWKWIGVLHELPQSTQAQSHAVLKGYCNLDHGDGHRSQDPDEYKKDILVLEAALKKDPTNTRYAFFLAETYKWQGWDFQAIEAYRQRVQMQGNEQEVYWSLYCIAKLQGDLSAYCQAHQYRPSRIEPIYEILTLLKERECWFLIWLLSRYALPVPLSRDFLFVESWVYEWGIQRYYETSVAKLGNQ